MEISPPQQSNFRLTPSETIPANQPSVEARVLDYELLSIIFRFLSPTDQELAICVCKNWKLVGENDRLKQVREFCFGKSKWIRYFGDVGVEPPLPMDIDRILNAQCIFWPDKQVKDTHLLVLIPQTVNGMPFHLDSLSELVKQPKTGHKTQYRNYTKEVKNELGNQSSPSHWALMTRDVIPDSRYKKYDDQNKLVASHAQKSGIPYVLPKALEATTAILMHYVETGAYLYPDTIYTDKRTVKLTYTRCQEKVNQNQLPLAIGGFSPGGRLSSEGLLVHSYYIDPHYSYGVGGARNF